MSDSNVRKIGSREATWFLVILFVSKILFADINEYINFSGTAAYIQTAWCAFATLVLFVVTSYLSGGDDIFSASYAALGNVGMKSVGILISALLLLDAGVMFRVYADIIASIALPDSSDFFIILLLILAAGVAAFAGVGTLASYAYIAGIVLVSSLALILVLNIPNYTLSNIYPLLGNGGDKILSGIGGINVYADIFLVFLMSVYFKKGESVKKSGVKAIIISGIVITVTTFLYILTVPYPASSGFALPILEIAFDVNLDVIFQRAEGLFLFLWIFSGFILIGAYLSFSVLSFERTFNLSDRRAVIGVFLLIAVCIALCADTSSLKSEVYTAFYKVFTAVAFILPPIVFGIKRLRR
ncbi:MAG: GerAB/ArcD/ProY family transporter [Clostridia bacterium]|nr:GerAB/ArcD/ProY family transporter [Clostridia bacterium]